MRTRKSGNIFLERRMLLKNLNLLIRNSVEESQKYSESIPARKNQSYADAVFVLQHSAFVSLVPNTNMPKKQHGRAQDTLRFANAVGI